MPIDQLQANTETRTSKQGRSKSMPDLDSFPRCHQRLVREGDARILIVRRRDGLIARLLVLEFVGGVMA